MRDNMASGYNGTQDVIELLEKFNNDEVTQSLIEQYQSKSLPELFSVSRREISHSAFLSKVLSDKSFHNCGTFPFLAFLRVIYKRSKKQRRSQQHSSIDGISQLILTGESFIAGVRGFTEKTTKDGDSRNNGRADIVLMADVLPKYVQAVGKSSVTVVVENKVGSSENNKQTEIYYDYYEKDYANSLVLYVYLTPIPSIELDTITEAQCACKEFIQINYQDILDGVLIPLKAKTESTRAKFILNEYIESLGVSFEDEESSGRKSKNKSKKTTIMAITPEYRDLLTAFFEHNKELIIASLEAINSDSQQDEDIRKDAAVCLGAMHKLRDNQKYSVTYANDLNKTNLGKGRLVLAVISDYAQKHNDSDEIKKAFCPKNSSKPIIKLKNGIKDSKRWFSDSPIKLADGEYVVDNQWGIGKAFDKFLEQARDAGYKISSNE